MTMHWQPPGFGPRRWTKANAYVVTGGGGGGGSRGFVLGVIGCAIAIGIGTGAMLARTDPPLPAIEAPLGEESAAKAVQPAIETIIPEVAPDPADAEWAGRAVAVTSSRTSTSSARTGGAAIRFGYCHAGGGTNCVIDGDTFRIGGEKVRIAGIDTPETHPPRCAREAQLGEAATRQLQAMLNSGAVTMTGIGRNRDKYGRLLRNVAVDGQDVGAALIAAGVAREYAGGRRPWC
jgi:micrococcal nuclease